MRRSFPCGHKGKGQTCHRCDEADLCLEKAYQNGLKWSEALEWKMKFVRLKAVGVPTPGLFEQAGWDRDSAWHLAFVEGWRPA